MPYVLVAFAAFVLILPVEVPDKTFVATLVIMGTRFPPLPVWLGAVAAFGVQCLVAVAAGALLAQLPRPPVAVVAAGLFAIGTVLLLRGRGRRTCRRRRRSGGTPTRSPWAGAVGGRPGRPSCCSSSRSGATCPSC
jgi:hypothetical protein